MINRRINVLFYNEPHPFRNSYTEHLHVAKTLLPVLFKSVKRDELLVRIFSNNDVIDQLTLDLPDCIGLMQRPTNAETQRMNALFGQWRDEAVSQWLELVRGTGDVTQIYVDILERLHFEQAIDVILTWSENGAVRTFSERHGIPVLFGELGPTRAPFPKTMYFDSKGTNGHAAYRKTVRTLLEETTGEGGHFPPATTWLFSDESKNKLQQTVSSLVDRAVSYSADYAEILPKGRYFYVPLQLADDLNTLLHSNFSSPLDFLRTVAYKARENGYNLVVKGHPGVKQRPYNFRLEIEALEWLSDNVPDAVILSRDCGPALSAYVMGNATYTVSINSSVGFESMVLGVPALVLGQAAFDADGWLQENLPLLPADQTFDFRDSLDALVSSQLEHVLVPQDLVLKTDYLYHRLVALEAGIDQPLSNFHFSNWYVLESSIDAFPTSGILPRASGPASGVLPRASVIGCWHIPPKSKLTLSSELAVFTNPMMTEEITLEMGQPCMGFIESVEMQEDNKGLLIQGWALDRERLAPPMLLMVISEGSVLSRHRFSIKREDVSRAFPEMAITSCCGFKFVCQVSNLANTQLIIQTSDGKGHLVSTVAARRKIGTFPPEAIKAELEVLQTEQLQRELAKLQQRILKHDANIQIEVKKGHALEARINAIHSSTSWRLTGPLRRVVLTLRRLW